MSELRSGVKGIDAMTTFSIALCAAALLTSAACSGGHHQDSDPCDPCDFEVLAERFDDCFVDCAGKECDDDRADCGDLGCLDHCDGCGAGLGCFMSSETDVTRCAPQEDEVDCEDGRFGF